MRKSLFVLFSMVWVFSFSQQSSKSDSVNTKNTFLLFEIGAVYPEIEFKDDANEKQLANNAFNVSNNRFALGVSGDLVDQLGYILTLSNTRYDIRTLYNNGMSNSQYFIDFLALDANLTLRLQSEEQRLTSKWIPLLKGGVSYNALVAGFQELNFSHLEDLKRNDDFSNKHIDFNIGLHLKRKLTESSHLWLGYNYKNGIMENENISKQKYSINTLTALVGFSVYADAIKRQKRARQRILDDCKNSIDSLRAELKQLVELKQKSMNNEWKAFVTPDKSGNSPLRKEIKGYVDGLFGGNQMSNKKKSNKLVILFPTDNDKYHSIFQRDLGDLILYLAQNPPNSIEIIGYADVRGENDSNLDLSMRKAETIENFLLVNGVNPDKISYSYHGETESFDEYMLISNRRVEIYID